MRQRCLFGVNCSEEIILSDTYSKWSIFHLISIEESMGKKSTTLRRPSLISYQLSLIIYRYRNRIRQLPSDVTPTDLQLQFLSVFSSFSLSPLPRYINTLQLTMSTLKDPTNATRSTPTIPAEHAILHIGSSTFISAPSPKVWAALTDTSTWPKWNSFVPRVTIRSQPDSPAHQGPTDQAEPSTATTTTLSPVLQKGTKMTFHVRMDPASTKPQASRDVALVVTEFDPPNPETHSAGRIVWVADYEAAGAMPRSLLAAERVHEVVSVEGGTEVRNWEAQVGWAVYAVKWMYGKRLQGNFEGWVDDLRGFVEGEESS